MAAQSIFSNKQLHKKSANEMQEMMFQKGVNWNDYPIRFKRGGFVKKVSYFEDVDKTKIPKGVKVPDKVERSRWVIIDPPIFTQDKSCTYSCIPIRRGDDVLSLWDVAEPNTSESFKTNSERLLRKFVAEADFIDFTTEVGVNGWGELDKWIENNIKK